MVLYNEYEIAKQKFDNSAQLSSISNDEQNELMTANTHIKGKYFAM